MAIQNMDIAGIFELKIEPIKEIFYNVESSYAIYGCDVLESNNQVTLNKFGNISLVGTMPKLELYKQYDITCQEKDNSKFGMQYEFVSMDTNYKPSTSEDQKAFLMTFLTPAQVNNIMKVYDYPINVVLEDKFDHKKVFGFGPYYTALLKTRIEQNFALFDLLSELRQYNISFPYIKKMYYAFNKDVNKAIAEIKFNPYILYTMIRGIGFAKADNIAKEMNIIGKDVRRLFAGIVYCLEENQALCNTYMFIDDLIDNVASLLNVDLVRDEVILLIKNDAKFYFSDSIIGLMDAYETELNIKDELLRLKDSNVQDISFDMLKFIKQQEYIQGFSYTKKQKEVFYNLLKNNVCVLTGSAGTGKSTVVNGILNMFTELGFNIIQMALAGKAAQVLENVTGKPASTIHRGLGWTPQGFMCNKYEPLDVDIVVLDEVSMIDIFLFNSLLEAIPDGCKLLLLGDVAQLESINPGNILYDIISSSLFPVVQLTDVFRQAIESGIIELATKVRNGDKFLNSNSTGIYEYGVKKDAFVFCGSKEETKDNIIKSYRSLLKKYKPEDITVLVPTKKSECGTYELNKCLQELVNPRNNEKIELELKYDLFREDDLVINVANNYSISWYDNNYNLIDEAGYVYNGELGVIKKIQKSKDFYGVYVSFKDRVIFYDSSDISSLQLAYALTIHKYQGSQSKAIILGMDTRSWYQAKRSLLYTGITRSQDLLVICADPKVLNRAININPLPEKKTFLRILLNNT